MFQSEREYKSATMARSDGSISASRSEFRPSSTAGISFFTYKQISIHFSYSPHSMQVFMRASRFLFTGGYAGRGEAYSGGLEKIF